MKVANVSECEMELLAAMPVATLLWDNDNNLFYASPQTVSLLGYSDDALIGASLSKLVTEPGLSLMLDQIDMLAGDDPPICERILMQRHSGRTFMGELQVSRLPHNRGCLAILSDIGEQHQKYALLQDRFAFLQAIIDAVPLPVFYRDSTGYTTGCNAAFEDLMQLQREDMSFMTLADLFPTDLATELSELDIRARQEPQTITAEIRLPLANGEEGEFIYYLSVFLTDDGRIESLLSVLVDITERHNAERALLKSYHELQETRDEVVRLERRSSALAVAVAANHEINQPLMIAKGNLEMLLMRLDDLPEKPRKNADRLMESITRIGTILQRFRSSNDVQFTDYADNTEMAILVEEVEEKDNE
ncbi:MAG: PAS domain S-box protein [Candidatus Cloacimonetes bacterium]|nr:PAS domain S-box protein [Candidatus Cloacimonadota bacterium]